MQTTAHTDTTEPYLWNPGIVFTILVSYFGLFGVTLGTQGVIWALMLQALSLSKGVFGTAQLSAPLISVFILLLAGPLCSHFQKKHLALVGLIALGSSLIWMSLIHDLWGLVGALMLSGVGLGTIEAMANSATLDWEAATGRKVMNLMHAGFSGGAVVGAIMAGTLLGNGITYPQLLQICAALAGILFLATLLVHFAPVETAAEGASSPAAAIRLLFSGPIVLALAAICLISTLGESVANIWAVIYLDELGAPAAVGGAAFALFNGTMFVGRLVNATLVARVGDRISLIMSGVCLLLAGIILVATAAVIPAIIAFALVGIAIAGVIPTILSATARLAPGQSGAVTGAIMSVAYLSFIIVPPIIGWVADATSLRAALLIVALAGAIQLILTRLIPSE